MEWENAWEINEMQARTKGIGTCLRKELTSITKWDLFIFVGSKHVGWHVGKMWELQGCEENVTQATIYKGTHLD
jgi:hypothetical protein